MQPLSQATREIMWNVSHVPLFYAVFVVALTVFGFGVYRRIRSWNEGKSHDAGLSELTDRLFFMLKEVFSQSRVRRKRFPGLIHVFVFYSFLVLLVTTSIVSLDHDLGIALFRGHTYVFLTVAAEIAGLFVLLGAIVALWRRHVRRPPTLEATAADAWGFALLALIIVTGFAVEGVRIGVTGDAEATDDPLVARFNQRLDRATRRENLFHLIHPREVVHLPEIDVIGLQKLEGALEELQRSVTRAIVGLGGEKGLRTARLHDLTEVLLAPPILDSAIACRCVDIVDAQIESLLDQRYRHIEIVGLLDGRLAAEAEDPDLEPGLAEIARRHRIRSRRVVREIGHLPRCFTHHALGYESRRGGRAELENISPFDLALVVL
jgi:nitrate reductase gamma subunit